MDNGFQPPARGIRVGIECRHIRLDIQERGAVQHIHIFNVESKPMYSDESHDRYPDRARAFWRPGRKHAPGSRVKERFHDEIVAGALMECKDQEDTREPLEIPDPVAVCREDLDAAPDEIGRASCRERV